MNAPRDPMAVGGSRHVGIAFALPWLIGFIGLTLLPAAASLILSFTRWDGLSIAGGLEWVGAEHYRTLLEMGDSQPPDPLFYKALGNSLYFSLIAVPLSLVTSLAVALLLNTRLRAISFFRTVFYLPHLLGGVATVMVWSWLFNPRFGPINSAIRLVYQLLDPLVSFFDAAGTTGWPTPDWFYSPATCKPALILMQLWLSGGAMLVFLAVLQRVPRPLHEAAAIDGANPWQRFRHITIPHISPAILFNAVIGLIFAMQSFDQAYLLHNRSQEDGLLFYMLHLYRVAFDPPYQMGRASAMSWILFAVIAVLTIPILLTARKRIYYEADQ